MLRTYSERHKPEVEEIYKLMQINESFAKKVIRVYKRELSKHEGLNADELNSYIWDQLRSCDEDKDEEAIERSFRYWTRLNEKNPLELRLLYNQWNGISD